MRLTAHRKVARRGTSFLGIRLLAGLIIIQSVCWTPLSFGQLPATPTDVEVKAAYLYKFGGFVAWPNPAPNGTFAICILGHDVFGPVLDKTIQGESMNGKPLAVRRISSPEQASQCRILFISPSEQDRLRDVLVVLKNLPVLTVSDMPRFVDRGGMIQFVLEDERVRFEVNLASAQHAGLTLSSQLLKVATAVQGGGRD